MRILLDCRMASWTGIGRYTVGLTRALSALGEDLELVCAVASPAESPVADAAIELASASPLSPQGALQLGAIQRRVRPDVTHCLHFPTPLPARHPLVVTLHDLTPLVMPDVMPSALKRAVYRFHNARAVRLADRVVPNSQHTARDLERFFPQVAPKLRVVKHSAQGFAQGPVATPSADLVAPAERYILSMGNTKPHKGLPSLLAAFQALGDEFGDLKLLLVGREDPGYIAGHVDAATAARVAFTGFVDDPVLRGLYRGAELFAFPSLYEGFGLPPLEAMELGTPVVCSDAASLPEVVADAACVFPAGDAPALETALREVLSDAAVRARLVAAGHARAAELTWDATAHATLEVYREVVHYRS